MATGKKKKKGGGGASFFGAVRFCRNASKTTAEETATIEATPTQHTTDIPMTSLSSSSSPATANAVTSTTTTVLTSSKSAQREWFAAVQRNDVRRVNTLLSRGVDVNQPDQTGSWSALHIAAWNNYVDLVELLIASGCDLDIPGVGGITAVSLAGQVGHLAVVQLLVGAGCDVTRRATVTLQSTGVCERVTAVHLAAQHGHVEVVRCLVSAGAAVDAAMTVRRVDGVTPLHLAVEAGHAEVIDYLIAAGSDVNTRTTGAPLRKPASTKSSAAATARSTSASDRIT